MQQAQQDIHHAQKLPLWTYQYCHLKFLYPAAFMIPCTAVCVWWDVCFSYGDRTSLSLLACMTLFNCLHLDVIYVWQMSERLRNGGVTYSWAPGFTCELLATYVWCAHFEGSGYLWLLGPLFCELTPSKLLVSHGCVMRLTSTNIDHLHISKCASKSRRSPTTAHTHTQTGSCHGCCFIEESVDA